MNALSFISMGPQPISRRTAIQLAGLSLVSLCGRQAAYALKPGKPSKGKLLNSIHEEKTPEEIEAEKERVAEERRVRLEKQRELQAAADRRKAGLEQDDLKDAEMGTNLRGQYYYPTARKRYLPRVKLAFDSIPDAEKATRDKKWSVVGDYATNTLMDAVLPMKLYASSLGGGGLSINAKFITEMGKKADAYEGAVNKLSKAAKKKDAPTALASLTDLRYAISEYRKLGKLESEDFGIGEIPTQPVGSGFSNNDFSLYRKNKSMQTINQNTASRSTSDSSGTSTAD